MSKENKKVSQKTVKKISKKKELEREIEKLRHESEKLRQESEKLRQESKKHVREWMEAGLKFFDDMKSTMDSNPIDFQKILTNYKTELSDRVFHHMYYAPSCAFSDYYFLLETIYCCNSDDLASYFGIKPKSKTRKSMIHASSLAQFKK